MPDEDAEEILEIIEEEQQKRRNNPDTRLVPNFL